MRPSSIPEPRPSLIGAALFALLAFLIFGVMGVIYGTIYQDSLPVQFDANQMPVSQEVAGWWGLVAGVAGALIAGWGWIAPRGRRFHICYLSGLACLIAAAWHAYRARGGFLSQELELQRSWGPQYLLLEGPAVDWFTATLGMVLILTAMIQDRR